MSGAGERDAPAVSGTLASARALIARELLDAHDPTLSLGAITLHPHQRRAVVRISKLLASHGGALLADPTGLGKTYVALAVASDVDHLLIVCPAALRENWTRALDRAGRTAQLISRERLSRGIPDQTGAPELVIVDESHHLRNPNTKCYDAVASLCDRRRILLLSATPVQNRRDDLIAQLALFLGGAAYEMTDQELARFVVRRDTADSLARLPTVVGPHWITLPVEDDVLDEIMRLPPCVPLADEGEAHALLRYVLLRQWSSSHAALIAGLRARLARGVALLAALDAGRRPTRRELTAWSHTEDAVQLALPEMLVPLAVAPEDGTALRESAVEHVAAVRALLDRLRGVHDADLARSDALRELRRRHGDARIIAFSQYAATVRGLSQLLMHRDGGVAELTGRGGRVAGGRLSRAEVLAQFSPGTPHVGAAERIDLLLTTDLASEGLDLQRASVVVHLDLPWNPARLEQRVGRVRRLGGQHERVFVYAMAPPARSEHVLDVETRLRAKLRVAAHVIGLTSTSLPDIEADDVDAPPALTSDVYTALECWRSADDAPKSDPDAPSLYAAAHCSATGYLALLVDGDDWMLVAEIGAGPTLDPTAVRDAVSFAEGAPVTPDARALSSAMTSLARWWERRVARAEIRGQSREGTRLRAQIGSRIAALLAAAPRHSRVALARRASAARQTLCCSLGIGAERKLALLAGANAVDESWLDRVAELGAGRDAARPRRRLSIPALILFQRGEP